MSDAKTAVGGNVYIIDDDEAVRDSVSTLVESIGLAALRFSSGDDFLAAVTASSQGCIVTDIRMPGLSGLDLQDQLAARGIGLPVIVLTGYGDVSAAVRAMKTGAIDFVEKPFNAQELLDKIQHALAIDDRRRADDDESAAIRERLASLTNREREVMELVAAGSANKVIALDLNISERTVEVHRGRAMKKMSARSVAELIHMLSATREEKPGRR
ncbi:MAG: response regulator [Gammaproteobacteria bacterium]|nr:response regulator [Gammaproteobacteria bacterium]